MESNLVVVSKINYKKSTWAKSFIEKNSMSALTDFFTALEKALKEECAKMNAGGVTPTSPLVVVSNLPRRRHPRKKCRAPDIPTVTTLTRTSVEGSMAHPATLERGSTLPGAGSETIGKGDVEGSIESSLVMKVILAVLGCLLLLNAFLYFKLSSLETAANLSVFYPPTIHIAGETPQSHQEWLMLLQQQETVHRSEVHSWHEVLVSAIKILHQAETDLENLKAHISTYGKDNIAIVAKPSQADIVNIAKAFGTPQTPSSISDSVNEKSSDPDVDKNNNVVSKEDSGTVNGESERIN